MKIFFILTILLILRATVVFAQGPSIQPNVSAPMQNINYEETVNINNIVQNNINPPTQQGNRSRGSNVSSGNSNGKPCTDCDKVKEAIKLSHASSSSGSRKRPFSMKKWARKIEGQLNLKMKKIFSRRTRSKADVGMCFNWR